MTPPNPTADAVSNAADDVQDGDRIQPIHVSTDHLGRYQSVTHIRDLAPLYIDEPTELGGKNSGPTAMESMLAALNSCSAMIMYVLKLEMRFDLQAVRFEADGWIDVRRIEMKRSKLKYSEVEPLARHFDRIAQRVWITTTEPDARIATLREETHRLCPMHALLQDASVPVQSEWIRLAPGA